MAKRVNKKNNPGINTKIDSKASKVDVAQLDGTSKIFGFIGIGFAIGALVSVLLIYSGVLPTKINMFGIEFNLPNYCSTICFQVTSSPSTLTANFSPTPSLTLTPTLTITPTSTLTPTPRAKTSVEFIDEYYALINKALYPSDLEKPWKYLSETYQCDPLYNCDLNTYRIYWWKHRVLYRLFECSNPYQVNVEYTIYKRTDIYYANPIGKSNSVLKYFLDFNDFRELKVISSVAVYAPDDECLLKLSRLTPVP